MWHAGQLKFTSPHEGFRHIVDVQECGLVPIVEPELMIEGGHDIKACPGCPVNA